MRSLLDPFPPTTHRPLPLHWASPPSLLFKKLTLLKMHCGRHQLCLCFTIHHAPHHRLPNRESKSPAVAAPKCLKKVMILHWTLLWGYCCRQPVSLHFGESTDPQGYLSRHCSMSTFWFDFKGLVRSRPRALQFPFYWPWFRMWQTWRERGDIGDRGWLVLPLFVLEYCTKWL